jgi:creatinine amidohydrolase/Fe(II)-dependent formamide hydrolase-like protein
MAEGIARELGNALVTATVKFVPQGSHDPATEQMRYAGTISLRAETYEAVLSEITRSLKAHGFREIILIGDSGGGQQESMTRVAEALDSEWKAAGVNVWHLPEFYEKDKNAAAFLEEELNINQDPITNIHTDYRYEAVMAVADPRTIRSEKRIAVGNFTTRGVEIGSVEQMQENGRKLIEYRSEMIANVIRNRREQEE